jgi:hypothetical protein
MTLGHVASDCAAEVAKYQVFVARDQALPRRSFLESDHADPALSRSRGGGGLEARPRNFLEEVK